MIAPGSVVFGCFWVWTVGGTDVFMGPFFFPNNIILGYILRLICGVLHQTYVRCNIVVLDWIEYWQINNMFGKHQAETASHFRFGHTYKVTPGLPAPSKGSPMEAPAHYLGISIKRPLKV